MTLQNDGGPLFSENQRVRLKASTSHIGVVLESICISEANYQYLVFFSIDEQRYIKEVDLEPAEGVSFRDDRTIYRELDDLRREILLSKLATPYGESILSLRASRVEFHPYQFKPVLKFLRNPDQRLLIADEVGLGKTIEAGIIMTELQARVDLARILICCPAGLKSKWRSEMRMRFEEEFRLLDATLIREFFDDFERNRDATRLRGIVSIELIRGQRFLTEIAEEQIHFDLIIIDEAHHCRNLGTRANELANLLADHSDALLLLTATPLHLGNEDLFHLLQVISPAEFDDFNTFEERITPNKYVNQASRLVEVNRPKDAAEQLRNIEKTTQSRQFMKNPYYQEVLSKLSKPSLTRNEAILVQRMLLHLNTISHIFTRTRKREALIGAPLREAKIIRFTFSEPERAFYEATVRFVRQHWRHVSNKPWSVGFALVTRERQAASCLPAFRDHYIASLTRAYIDAEDLDMLGDLLENESDDQPEEIEFPPELIAAAHELDAYAKGIGEVDTKFRCFYKILREVLDAEPNAKILIFSFFKKTLEYLKSRLLELNVGTEMIHGDIPVRTRQGIVENFRRNDDIRVLLSSEVGSEGLDFQFCHILFNYDLPWNPMKVEQRIGRIDRFGQKEKRISIFSFVAEDTIEDRIYARLYERIELFKEAVGDLEEILGKEMRELSRILYQKELTPAEEIELADRISRVIIQKKQEQDAFDEHRLEFLGQDSIIQRDIQEAIESGRYLSSEEICALVKTYFKEFFPRARFSQNEVDASWCLDPDEKFFAEFQRFVLRSGEVEPSQSHILQRVRVNKPLPMTFSDDLAYNRSRLVEFITPRHPITKAAIYSWNQRTSSDAPVFIVSLSTNEALEGTYFFFLFVLEINAVRDEQRLIPIVLSQETFEIDELMCAAFMRTVQKGSQVRGDRSREIDEKSIRDAKLNAIKHMGQFQIEIENEEKSHNDAIVDARLFSLEQTYEAKAALIRNKLNKVYEKRIRRMYEAQLENIRARYEMDCADLEDRRKVSVSFSLRASGYLNIIENREEDILPSISHEGALAPSTATMNEERPSNCPHGVSKLLPCAICDSKRFKKMTGLG